MRYQAVFVCVLGAVLVLSCGGPGGPAGSGGESFARNAEAGADLVLINGRIVTVSDAPSEVSALAAADGRIVAVGDDDAVAAHIGQRTEVVNLQGRLAVPGFIETHAHFLGIGKARLQLDLRTPRSWDGILALVEQAVERSEPGEWIEGRGWHQDKWDAVPTPNVEGFPVHDGLSAIAPDNPVVLTHASGHASFVNARAMELAGIGRETPDPPGGEILRFTDGRPTGLLRETAEGLLHAARSTPPTPAEVRRQIELASQECLSKGITSFHDAGSSFEAIEHLKRAAEDKALGVRLWVMALGSEPELENRIGDYLLRDHANHQLTVGGIKLWLDGALGSRGAWLLEPYSDSPQSAGLNTVPLDEARRIADIAARHDLQLCIHAIGDRANREVLDLYEAAYARHPREEGRRWRIEHAQHLHPDDIPRFSEIGVIAAMQSVHCTSDGPWVPDRLGERRAAEGAYVWRSLLDSGAVVVNGTDAPVEDVDPLASYRAAVTRRMSDGEAFHPDQVMTRMEALASYTRDAAFAGFQEGDRGTLEVGKLADLTVLSHDILRVDDNELPDTRVLYTIVGGRVLYRAP